LERRKEELEGIKKVTGQIVDITNHMKMEVSVQSENLTKIESHVQEIQSNTKKAEFEIDAAEKDTRSHTKKYCIIAIVIIFFLISLFLLLYFILIGNGETTKTNPAATK
jgi:t-SNARE complex subunit (syntaxin)